MNEEIEYSIKEINENFEHFGKDVNLFLEKDVTVKQIPEQQIEDPIL